MRDRYACARRRPLCDELELLEEIRWTTGDRFSFIRVEHAGVERE